MGASDIVGELIVLQGIDLEILKVNEELECLEKELSILTSNVEKLEVEEEQLRGHCLLYTSPSPRDRG